MPNHVINKITITGTPEDMKDIFSSLKTDTSDFDFNLILPMPEELKKTVSSSAKKTNQILIDKYGYDNWYNWATENWGTKWNAYEVIDVSDTEVQFNTAWSCADNLILKLSSLHPAVDFTLTFADEDVGSNCGILTYKNGVNLTFEDKSTGNLESDEASIRWAMIIAHGSDEEWYKEE